MVVRFAFHWDFRKFQVSAFYSYKQGLDQFSWKDSPQWRIWMNKIKGNISPSPEQLAGWFLSGEPNPRLISSALTNRCHCSQKELTLRLSSCEHWNQIEVLKLSNAKTQMLMFFFFLTHTPISFADYLSFATFLQLPILSLWVISEEMSLDVERTGGSAGRWVVADLDGFMVWGVHLL